MRDMKVNTSDLLSLLHRRISSTDIGAQLLIRGQGQTKQGLKASVDPGEPEV